jgi:hypothetical protein
MEPSFLFPFLCVPCRFVCNVHYRTGDAIFGDPIKSIQWLATQQEITGGPVRTTAPLPPLPPCPSAASLLRCCTVRLSMYCTIAHVLCAVSYHVLRRAAVLCCAVLCCAVLCSLCLSSPGSVSGRLDYHRHNARQDRGHGGCAAQNCPCSFCFRVACPEPVLANHRFSDENATRETNATFILSNSGPLCVLLLPFLVFRHHQSAVFRECNHIRFWRQPRVYGRATVIALYPALCPAVCSALLSALLSRCALLRSVVVRSHLLLLTFVVTSCHVRCDV